MKPVLDPYGVPVPHLFKDEWGQLVVCNEGEHNKYKKLKQNAQEISQLKDDVAQLKQCIQMLLKEQHG